MYISQWKVYTAEIHTIKYLFKTSSLKSHFSLCKLLLDFATTATNYADFATTAIN